MEYRETIDKLLHGNDLEENQAKNLFTDLLKSPYPESEVKVALALLHKKGEIATELFALIKLCRQNSHMLKVPKNLKKICDGCGTGGDHLRSFNISTIACIVAAGAGAYVAKHGNRSLTSRCGSSDLMEAFGVNLAANSKQMLNALQKTRFTYFHAPKYAQAFQNIQAIRKELGVHQIRTIFNIVGPLLNPLRVKRQVIGVYHQDKILPVIKTLQRLSLEKALVFSGQNGMDELTTHQKTYVAELHQNRIRNYILSISRLPIRKTKLKDLRGGNVAFNKKIALQLLRGKDRSTRVDAILLNSAAILYVCDLAKNLTQGIQMARESLNTGRALSVLNQLIKISHAS